MSDDAELSISELRKKRAEASAKPAPHAEGSQTTAITPTVVEAQSTRIAPATVVEVPQHAPGGGGRGGGIDDFDTEEKVDLPFDPWRLPGAVLKRWYWLVIAGVLFGILGGAFGYWRNQYKVSLTLNLRDINTRWVPSADSEAYKPPQLASQTLVDFLTSPQLIRQVSLAANPPISEKKLLSSISVSGGKNSEAISVTLSGKDPKALVGLANLYASNAVEQSLIKQRADPEMNFNLFSNQLVTAQLKLTNYHRDLADFRNKANIIDPEIQNPIYVKQLVEVLQKLEEIKGQTNLAAMKRAVRQTEPLRKSLKEAEDKIAALRASGKQDLHPDVARNLELVERIKKQLAAGEFLGNASQQEQESIENKELELQIAELEQRSKELRQKVDAINDHASYYAQIKAGIVFQETMQTKLKTRQSEAQQYLEAAEGYYDFSPVLLKNVDTRGRYMKAAMFGVGGGVFGFVLAAGLILLVEVADSRIKTAADLKRITQLPLLATLGDLNKMDDAARKAWAFRTWTILSGTLSRSLNSGTVCGVISCMHGEGRSTWVEMLVNAARERGFEVTKLEFGESFGDEGVGVSGDKETPKDAEAAAPVNGNPAPTATPSGNSGSLVAVPAEKRQVSLTSNTASVIHVQLPGLVWNLERRIQFQEELSKWQAVSNAVILVDLPPASMPEAILLAENLPQVIWLADSGKPHARETRLHLETLRHARCKLVGAVLNHEPKPLIKL